MDGRTRQGEARRRSAGAVTYTYAAHCDGAWLHFTNGFLKIGKSWNPNTRLNDLQVGNPEPIRLVATIKGDREREVHALLEESGVPRVSGEWFVDGPATREILEPIFGVV